jgi:hypothetical protein
MPEPSREALVRYAQEANQDRLLALSNVIGVATGFRMRGGEFTDEVVVQIFVERKVEEERLNSWERVPSNVLGYERAEVATDVVETTIPEAQQDTTRYRPVPGGCSIGAEARVNAGTLGGWACDSGDEAIVLLSNNHVISNLDTLPVLTRIVQPGQVDGGILPDDVIGDLKRHVPVNTVANPPTGPVPTSVVDAAIGRIDPDIDIDHDVIDVGPAIYEVRAPALNMNVQKRGRTTRLTANGRITSVGMTFNTNYRGATRISSIQNAFRITSTDGNAFSASGDSGSLIFDQAAGTLEGTLPVVGLLYAGGTFANGTPFTDANDINAVFGALGLETVCSCVARALIRAVFGDEEGRSAEGLMTGRDRERQVRRLRRTVLRESEFGGLLDELVTTRAATAGKLLAEDDVAFSLAVRALRPLREARTVADMLRAPVTAETVGALEQLSELVSRRDEELGQRLGRVVSTLREAEGSTLGDVLGVAVD